MPFIVFINCAVIPSHNDLVETLRRTLCDHDPSVSIYPNATLLDTAGDAIARFLSSQSQNLKYFGITGLAAIVESHPEYAATHQMSVIECWEDDDETLQRRTLDLL